MQVLLYSVPEAAKMLMLADVTVWKMVYARKIASVMIGRSRRIHINEINRLIDENTIPCI